jgi:hypothetical protein
VQQGAAGQRAPQRKVQVGDADSPAEREADQVATAVTSGGKPSQLIVDRGPLTSGQMLKGTFLDSLRAAVTQAANAELAPGYAAISGPLRGMMQRLGDIMKSGLQLQRCETKSDRYKKRIAEQKKTEGAKYQWGCCDRPVELRFTVPAAP